jgi:hypoxanthine phosphoribosyltransferase
MSKKQVAEFVRDTRADLSATLEEIEHRLSPAEVSKKTVQWVSDSFDRNPTPWVVAAAAAVVGAVTAVLWAIFSDD